MPRAKTTDDDRRPRTETCSMWLALLGLVVACAPACPTQTAPPGTPPPIVASPVGSSRSASSLPPSEAAPSAVLTPAALLTCIPAPALISRPSCALGGDAGAGHMVCADLAPAGSPTVDVLSIVVARGSYDFAQVLGIPSMKTLLDAGTPGVDAMAKMYRDFEGPQFEALANGRQVKLEARSLMLGGVVHWATLQSPQGSFTTALVQWIPLHDAPLADADRRAIEAWNLATMLACLDGQLWPEASRP